MADKIVILKSIVEFLRAEFNNSEDEDQSESIEVAIQCIESAFNLAEFDHASYTAIPDLAQVFQANLPKSSGAEDQKKFAQAEELKNKGNEAMQQKRIQEALNFYSQAIALNDANPVYYCNRAAAYQNLDKYQKAVDDCKKAISLDNSYSKAYTRLGLAYISLELHQEARDAYKKALELEPSNLHYKNNLQMAEENLRNVTAAPPVALNNQTVPSALDQLNISQFLNNPSLTTMAAQMLGNPEMQQMYASNPGMQTLMSGTGTMEGQNISTLVTAGQQLAQVMQEINPQLVEELRRQIEPIVQESNASSPAGDSNTPPPSDDTQDPDKN